MVSGSTHLIHEGSELLQIVPQNVFLEAIDVAAQCIELSAQRRYLTATVSYNHHHGGPN